MSSCLGYKSANSACLTCSRERGIYALKSKTINGDINTGTEMTYAFFTISPTHNAFRVQQASLFQKPHYYTQDTNWYGQTWSALEGFLASCWQLSKRFGKTTTIHGLDRLLAARASRWERFAWLCTFITALMGAIYVCLKISRRYNEGHFQTVVDSTRYHVYRIPFPVVTICNANRLNWKRIDEAKKLFMPGENSTEKLALFERVVAAYDDVSFGRFAPFTKLRYEPLTELDHLNFTLVVEFMTWRCEEMLTNCVWRHSSYNCCDIFSHRRSKQGLCLAFNTLESAEGKRMKLLDPTWPWHTGSAGPLSALNVRVLINPEKHFPNRTNDKGISIMITEPYVWHREPFSIPAYTKTLVEIDPVIYFYDNETRSLSSDQRQCVFNDEQNSQDFKSLHGYIYMIENCLSECHQEYLVRYCNCTMDLFFPPGQHRPCRAKDLPCLAQNNDFFLYSHQPGEEKFVRTNYEGMICKCFRNCYSLNYIGDVRPTFLPPEVYGNLSYVDLDVHYRFETMMVYRTSLVFGWVDLMVSFGGIAGLFLGCSLISGIELTYFICIEAPANVLKGLRQKWQRRGIHSADTAPNQTTLSWSRTRFNIQSQLENHMLNVPTKPLDKQQLSN